MPAVFLVAGDLIVLLLFVIVGRQDHDMTFSISDTLETAIPFALGWLIALLLFRTYRTRSVTSVRTALLYTLLTCVAAVPLGLLLRSLWMGRPPTGSFALVAYPLVASFMVVWRVLYVYLHRWIVRRKPS